MFLDESPSNTVGSPDSGLDSLIAGWNTTTTNVSSNRCIHELFEEQARRTPDAVAAVFENRSLTYRQLSVQSSRLASYLNSLGVEPEVLVGISVNRSLDMIIGLLGILKAGGAYVPLDPSYPKERLAMMIDDARLPVIVTDAAAILNLPENKAEVVELDRDRSRIQSESLDFANRDIQPANLAYVIYTSGSTGKPKGVMLTHRNVVNFFMGMDHSIGDGASGVWLAVTSISFDISVLELLWTLCRGFKVVIQEDSAAASRQQAHTIGSKPSRKPEKQMEFSLFYFASEEGEAGNEKYKLMIEGAKFADRSGFTAVWTPERHFHSFGGLYPNPSVTSAALAMVTERVKLRAGSVVLPLHHPLRVAEEWALVDNLSGGRVGISFASGWQPNDFALAPENFAANKQVMFREIETVRKLWRGEPVTLPNGKQQAVAIKTLPRPIQPELPIWVTAAGTPETFRMAGEIGANLLTHLLGQKIEQLTEKITIYRESWREHGHSGDGHVTLMLHTFVGEDRDAVRDKVRKPFREYLRSSVDLIKNSPWSFSAFPRRPGAAEKPLELNELAPEEMDALLEHSFNRYFDTSGLFGTPDECADMADTLRLIGVDEIACLIDFGIDTESVLASLEHLNSVRERSNPSDDVRDYSIPAQIKRHGVTHLQCTPSMARMLTMSPDASNALRSVRKLFVGGEAMPPSLAGDLSALGPEIHNMFGPTETTIWSSTYQLNGQESGMPTVPIGQPILNTQIYILDEQLRHVPAGIVGELYIGGAGVARGYLNRPDLTAERFIRNPFSPSERERLYRTGDLARYRPDGALECLGRLDQQIKLRGHRLELGEIEAALGLHPAIREAAVVARGDSPEDKRLLAYIVPKPSSACSNRELRTYLEEKLPEYMIPSTFITLDALPLTPNGKIDRNALPDLAPERPGVETLFKEPNSPIQKQLAEIWSEALGIGHIGLDDNFFDLGGHSLSAVQITFRIQQVFEIDLPLQSFLGAPTISSSAAALEELMIEKAENGGAPAPWASLQSIHTGGTHPPLFCVHPNTLYDLRFNDLAVHLGSDQPFYALQPMAPENADKQYTFVEMAARNIEEMRQVQPHGPYYLSGYCFGGQMAFEMALQLQKQGEEVAFLGMLDAFGPLYRPPTLVNLLRLSVQKFRTLLPSERAAFLARKWGNLRHRASRLAPLHLRPAQGLPGSLPEYAPGVYPGRLTLFCIQDVERDYVIGDSSLGWNTLAQSGIEIIEVPGSHESLLKQPNVSVLASHLRDCLDKSRRPFSSALAAPLHNSSTNSAPYAVTRGAE